MSSTSKKRDLPSPIDNISRDIKDLKNDFHKKKQRKVHFFGNKNNEPVSSTHEPVRSSSPVKGISDSENIAEPILITGFETSQPFSAFGTGSVSETSKIKKKKLKIILHEHSFDKPYNLETINSHIKNFKIISIKEAHTKSSVLICEIDINEIDSILDKDNWSEKIKKLQVDKRSNLLDSFCVNKTAKEPESGPPITLKTIYEHLEYHGIPRVFNLRREGNLVIFEVVKGDISDDFSFITKNNNLIIKHHVRPYDPIDNYITQCKKCFKFGHVFSNCKEDNQLCSWCGKVNCSRKCSVKKCVNCNKAHSAFYKGCEVYKQLFAKATTTRNNTQKLKKINIITESVTEVKNTCQTFEKSYAQVVNFEKKSLSLEAKVEECSSYIKNVENNLSEINKHLKTICENSKTQTLKLNNLDKSLNSVKKDISLLTPRIESLEKETKSLSNKIETINETFVSKTELSEELSSELSGLSDRFIGKTPFLLTLFECLFAIDQGHMSGFMEICYHLLNISSRHLGPLDKEGFTNKFTELQGSSLICSQTPPDNNTTAP